MIILVTGASSFVGKHVMAHLAPRRWDLRLARRSKAVPPSGDERIANCVTGDLLEIAANKARWMSALEGVSAVIHLAAFAHVPLGDKSVEDTIRRVNVDGTSALAKYAAEAGVRRFVCVSSLKAQGEWTIPGQPFTETDKPRPEDIYGQTKREAEIKVLEICSNTRMEPVIIRPPLVYGEGVGANMAALIKAVKRGLPLPFAWVKNSRSLIYAGNLASAIAECVENDQAGGETFLVSDGKDVSTPELIRAIGQALGASPLLLPAPMWGLKAMGLAGDLLFRASGRKAPVDSGVIRRLTGSLAVDISRIKTRLKWNPPYSFEEGIRRTTAAFGEKPAP